MNEGRLCGQRHAMHGGGTVDRGSLQQRACWQGLSRAARAEAASAPTTRASRISTMATGTSSNAQTGSGRTRVASRALVRTTAGRRATAPVVGQSHLVRARHHHRLLREAATSARTTPAYRASTAATATSCSVRTVNGPVRVASPEHVLTTEACRRPRHPPRRPPLRHPPLHRLRLPRRSRRVRRRCQRVRRPFQPSPSHHPPTRF